VYVPEPQAARAAPRSLPQEAEAPASLQYKVVRPSLVVERLAAPDGAVARQETVDRLPGVYDVVLPGEGPAPLAQSEGATAGKPMNGRWTLEVEATDDLGRPSRMAGSILVNRTIADLRAKPETFLVPPGGHDGKVVWEQTRRGFVTATIEGRGGAVVRTLAQQRLEPGRAVFAWNGLDRRGKRAPGGYYTVRVIAKNDLGVLETTTRVLLRQIPGRA
jgi:hypothetical protein